MKRRPATVIRFVSLVAVTVVAAQACVHATPGEMRAATLVASYPLALGEAPDEIVTADDGAVWIASNQLQAFVRVSAATGRSTEFGYANGGATVLGAAAGDDGSLWYLDGLNNTQVWRVDTSRRVRALSLQPATKVGPGAIASFAEASQSPAAVYRDEIVRFADDGSRHVWLMPRGHAAGSPLAVGSDGTLWFTTYTTTTGVGWLKIDGLIDFALTPSLESRRLCGRRRRVPVMGARSWRTRRRLPHRMDIHRWVPGNGSALARAVTDTGTDTGAVADR